MNSKQQINLRAKVLVVDDHIPAGRSICDVLHRVGHDASPVNSAAEALAYLERQVVDLIITDLRMPGMDGLQFMRELTRRCVDAQVVLITAHASVTSAVEAMRYGAHDYLEKPFDADELERTVEQALSPIAPGGRRPRVPANQATLIGNSPQIHRLQAQIAQVAPTDTTVLIQGESGTGKELVARHLHAQSSRAKQALVPLNCPALSPQLMESELFGHERGAFTGADSPRIGRFELAHGGTILLDEISEIELPLQAKLLRVLQEKTLERVGSSDTRDVDVRVVATTNRDMLQEVQAGAFRQDLYYRLAVVPLQVPPLRDRPEDIPLLATHFLHEAANRLQREPLELGHDAQSLLSDYHWPGNVRELENIITRASVLASTQVIIADDLQPWLIDSMGEPAGDNADQLEIAIGTSLHEMERRLIEATLEQFNSHRGKTAQALGIGVRTLSNKLRAYGYAPRAREFSRIA